MVTVALIPWLVQISLVSNWQGSGGVFLSSLSVDGVDGEVYILSVWFVSGVVYSRPSLSSKHQPKMDVG